MNVLSLNRAAVRDAGRSVRGYELRTKPGRSLCRDAGASSSRIVIAIKDITNVTGYQLPTPWSCSHLCSS
jgi:hypothetical protein